MRWEVVWAGETKPRSRKKGDWGHVALVLAVLAADAHAQIRTLLSDSPDRLFRPPKSRWAWKRAAKCSKRLSGPRDKATIVVFVSIVETKVTDTQA